MKSSLTFTFETEGAAAAISATALRGPTLGALATGIGATVTAVRLAVEEADWLRAIGLFEGQTVHVMRRALFGGPLHVSTGSGGEFAVDRTLAAQIEVRVDENP